MPPPDLSLLHQRIATRQMSDLQRDVDFLIREVRMRPQRLRIPYTMEELQQIFEFPQNSQQNNQAHSQQDRIPPV